MMGDQATDNQTSQVDGASTAAGGEGTAGEESFTSVADKMASSEGSSTEGGEGAKADKAVASSGADSGEKKEDATEEKLAAWGDQLSDEIKGNKDIVKSLSKFGKVSDLAKSYVELEKKLGNMVSMPGKDATDEERKAFMVKMGVPENEDGYKCTEKLEPSNKKFLQKLLYTCGLTEAQGERLVKSIGDIGGWQKQSILAKRKEAGEKLEADLHSEYGAAYRENMGFYKRGLEGAGAGVVRALAEAGLSTNMDIVKYFVNAGKYGSEGATPGKTAPKSKEYKSVRDGGAMSFFN